MTRIYKLYDLPYAASASGGIIPGRRIATSSYPGNLFSTDDWYTLGSGLAVTETTIDNHNTDLWVEVKPTTGALTCVYERAIVCVCVSKAR